MRKIFNYIDVQNLSYSYDSTGKILDGISFSCTQGETTSIVGGSGSGKSTVLKLISSILPCGNSSITIDSLSTIGYKKSGRLSFMFQEASLLPHLSVAKNVSLPIKIQKKSHETNVDSLIDTVGLSNYKDYLPKALSGGMKTRVALARSFVTAPKLLLLDEPFSALDISWKSKLYKELVLLQEQNNTTIVLVTHDIQEAILLSDKVLVLGKTGKLIGQEIISTQSVTERIQDVNAFTVSNEYQSKFVRVQRLIMEDGIKEIAEQVISISHG